MVIGKWELGEKAAFFGVCVEGAQVGMLIFRQDPQVRFWKYAIFPEDPQVRRKICVRGKRGLSAEDWGVRGGVGLVGAHGGPPIEGVRAGFVRARGRGGGRFLRAVMGFEGWNFFGF